jgi:hypothetical protein
MTTEHKIVKGTVTIDGQIYKAFENSIDKTWSIYAGTSMRSDQVSGSIKAKSATEALKAWLAKLGN